ncbi:MAG TPA: ATP-binding protein, partial [Xanthomonadales bacterium]|nr:ATP-binding protein [Xanthomonadales bacterium]
AAERGAMLTRQLLAFARRDIANPLPVEVNEVIRAAASMLRRTLGEQVAIETDCDPTVPPVFADAGQLEAALLNLALNARDAMPRGGRLRIGVREQSVRGGEGGGAPGEYVVFSVGDSGLGMAPDVLARAFEPFFTTKPPGKGSGLGLSMVYGFVTQSGGHLGVESELGYGTTIELFLPRAPGSSATEPGPSRAGARPGSETILVVEDEPEVRGIAIAFLRSLGYRTLECADAASALELLARHPDVDALFSDIALGVGANGRELGREARRLRPDLPVLLTTGFDASTGPDEEFALLPKPYRREELAQALRSVLDRTA